MLHATILAPLQMYFGPHAVLHELFWQHTADTGRGSGFSQSVKKYYYHKISIFRRKVEWMRKYANKNYQTNLITVSNQCNSATWCKSFKSLFMFNVSLNCDSFLKAGVLSLFNNENANYFGE